MKNSSEKKATILLSDMVGFTKRTIKMDPTQVSHFLIDYRQYLEKSIMEGPNCAQYFEHSGGDASASVFETQDRSVRAFRSTMRLIGKMKNNEIAPTRFGLYSGSVIEAEINDSSFRFGNCFSVAGRLRELCDYFDTPVLMDRDVAMAQDEDKEFLACVGKITPKGIDHPIHIFTIYKPGIHKIPLDVDKDRLAEYVDVKNRSVEYFHGNKLKGMNPDFSKARQSYYQASVLFEEMTGHADLASRRILEFIEEHNAPAMKFESEGIKLENKNGVTTAKDNLNRLGRELLRALDTEIYKNFVLDTRWQKWFEFQWKGKGEIIFRIGEPPDGVYFITKGKVDVLNWENEPIAQLGPGNVFGEMAYFPTEKVRNATVVASTDLEMYFIPGKDFVQHPEIENLLGKIAKYRALNKV